MPFIFFITCEINNDKFSVMIIPTNKQMLSNVFKHGLTPRSLRRQNPRIVAGKQKQL